MNFPKIGSLILLVVLAATHVKAGIISKAAREASDFLLKKFGKEVAEEGAEHLAGRIATAAARHGDDILDAVRKVGPKAISLVDDAGEHAPQVMKLLTRYGDDAARVLSTPRGMSLISRYGDEAAEVMMKHKGIAEPLVESLGEPAVKALASVGPQNGRRIAMMAQGAELAAMGHEEELLDLIAKRGNEACDFIWRNKAVLAGSTVMAAFIVNPEPYLDGTKDLSSIAVDGANDLARTVGEVTVKPAVVAVGDVAGQAVGGLFWSFGLILVGAVVAGGFALKKGLHKDPEVKAAATAVWERCRQTVKPSDV